MTEISQLARFLKCSNECPSKCMNLIQIKTPISELSWPHFKKWGLYWIWVVRYSVRHSVCHSVHPSQFCFRSISWEQIDQIIPNCVYVLILTRSSLRLLHIIFRTFVLELWPLTNIRFFWKICFRSIYWGWIDRISPNFVCALILTISRLGLLPVIFRQFLAELWPLIYVKILI